MVKGFLVHPVLCIREQKLNTIKSPNLRHIGEQKRLWRTILLPIWQCQVWFKNQSINHIKFGSLLNEFANGQYSNEYSINQVERFDDRNFEIWCNFKIFHLFDVKYRTVIQPTIQVLGPIANRMLRTMVNGLVKGLVDDYRMKCVVHIVFWKASADLVQPLPLLLSGTLLKSITDSVRSTNSPATLTKLIFIKDLLKLFDWKWSSAKR